MDHKPSVGQSPYSPQPGPAPAYQQPSSKQAQAVPTGLQTGDISQAAGEEQVPVTASQSQSHAPLSHAPPSNLTHFSSIPEDPTSLNYTRDPHILTAYLVPFPPPAFHHASHDAPPVPARFMIYTPPPPPIPAPKEGEKESKVHKLQRKWQDEVRAAKTSDAKVTSWKGAKGRVTKGIDWAMGQTKSSSLEFLNRIPPEKQKATEGHDHHAEDGVQENDTTKATVGLEEMVLIYPENVKGTQEEIRAEFVNSMLRTKSKAQRDAIIATGLIPVSAAIDILATLIWPFGGLLEIDTVWAVSSIRGAKTARSVTKRINSSATDSSKSGVVGKLHGMMQKATSGGSSQDEHTLKLTFVPSSRIEILNKYLAAECHSTDRKLFPSPGVAPTETEVVQAIGWHPSQTEGETKNWEDEQWELQQVKDDIKQVMHKGAKEWDKWCSAYEKDPKKAMGK